MCSRKCFRVHTLVILGVILTIVLVCIVGITLTNSINISNIIKLREKVASDSAAATGANAVQTRAALVEQQYSTLQQHHLSRSDLNYIAATHPKNLQRFAGNHHAGGANGITGGDQAAAGQNKIIIEIGIRNFSSAHINSSASGEANSTTNSSSTSDTLIDKLIEPITSAIVDGNIDSISVPAIATATVGRQVNESLTHLFNARVEQTRSAAGHETQTQNMPQTSTTQQAAASTTDTWQLTTTTATMLAAQPGDRLSIADHSPGQIDFAKREHVKQVSFIHHLLLALLSRRLICLVGSSKAFWVWFTDKSYRNESFQPTQFKHKWT
ncbi:uncharacterized protein LOC105665046 isoform X2 [Ceratitis capitata]|uniref:uncharacterized protein LOC105665046 isoform X2 n=1 Tax=Ceratitis capitata TaxID=7213 RepID=UPI000A122E9B|nr:uncharacterized protein LOC105665046 isoform X2 [Ceratitis capitata]